MNTKQLLLSSAVAAALVAPGVAHAQSAQTFNMQVPSASSSYTDGSGNIYTLSIPSTINIGTLTFTPAGSGPTIAATGVAGNCGTGSSTCSIPGVALTSGDKLFVSADADTTFAATPITLSGGTGAIGTCTAMTGASLSNATSDIYAKFFTCSVTTSGTPTNIVLHFSSALSNWGAGGRGIDVHGGSDHGNGNSSTGGTGTSASLATVAGSNGQPSANALVFYYLALDANQSITPTPGWTVIENSGEIKEYFKPSSAGAVTASGSWGSSTTYHQLIAAFQ